MDSILYDSLNKAPLKADDHYEKIEESLWFVLKILALLAALAMVEGVLGRHLIVFANGFYLTGSLAYVGGLILAHHESVRPADKRYPFGYGNRAKVFQLASLCVLGVAGVYMFFRILTSRGTASSATGLGSLLGAAVVLGAAVLMYRKFALVCQEVDSKELQSLGAVVKGAVITSSIVMAVMVYRSIFPGKTLEIWAGAVIIVVTMYFFVLGFYETFFAITDRNGLSGASGTISRLARHAAREADILSVRTRNVGHVMHIEIKAAFRSSFTIAQANAVERDIESLLRRTVRRVGQVVVYWEDKDAVAEGQ
ncbi:cation transporter [Candidatus Hydrogenedentota bacterium]